MIKVVGIVILLIAAARAATQQEIDALNGLYNSTNGDNWTKNDNWGKGDPCSNLWYGVSCTNGLVTSLIMFQNNLDGELNSNIGGLTNLQTLILSSNFDLGGTIPASFGSLSSLNHVEMSDCSLVGTFPSTIGQLTALQYLIFDINGISGIPPQIANLTNLQVLNLQQNRISSQLPDVFGNMKKLQILNLMSNQNVGTIPQSIGQLTSLTNLYLAFNLFTGTIPLSFYQLGNLQSFYLRTNLLNGTIPDIFNYMPNLQLIDISVNPYLTGSLPQSLSQLKNLKEMIFSNCSFTDFPPYFQDPGPPPNIIFNARFNCFSCPLPSYCTYPPLGDGACIPCSDCD